MRKKRYTRDDLTPQMGEFIDEYVAQGGTREGATRAVRIVYGYDKSTASSQATRLLKNEKIRDVLIEETTSSFAALAVLANQQLTDILVTGQWHGQPVKPNDGLKAIASALERGIGPVANIIEVNHTNASEIPVEDLREAIMAEMMKLPDQDRAKIFNMLGGADIIDVEALEVDPEAPWGHNKDGTPTKRPGVKPMEKRFLPGPEATKPEDVSTPLETRIANLKSKARREKIAKITEENEDA